LEGIVSQSFDFVYNNIVKIIKQSKSKNEVIGTGFFINKENCVTCTHVIYSLDKLQISHRNEIYDADWCEELSNPEKDIAVLRVKCNVEPLLCAGDSFPGMQVTGCGFPRDMLQNIPNGTPFTGKLSHLVDTTFPEIVYKIKKNAFKKKWNSKPIVNIQCHQFNSESNLSEGMSGSPVCNFTDYRIIGMLSAISKGNRFEGYVIPIKSILGCIEKKESRISSSPQMNTNKMLEIGNKYFSENDYEKAIECYDQICNDPVYTTAFTNKGICLDKLGRYDEAIKSHEFSIFMDERKSKSWIEKGVSLHNAGKFDDAIECYDKALKLEPDNLDLWNAKGLSLSYLKKYSEAIECYDQGLKLSPNNAWFWNNKSYSLYSLDKFDDAIYCCERAIELDPYNGFISAWAYNNKGLVFLKRKKYIESIKCFNNSIKFKNDWFWSWYNNGTVLCKVGKFDKSIDCYFNAYLNVDLYPFALELLKEGISKLVSEIHRTNYVLNQVRLEKLNTLTTKIKIN
jgi:tetratricopeptide (TPR) repeat protein